MQDIYTKFGQMVRVARAKKGYTQLKLAERLHTTDRTVDCLCSMGQFLILIEVSIVAHVVSSAFGVL